MTIIYRFGNGSLMNKYDFIRNDEELYRHYSYDSETKVKINSKAFFDPRYEPSVDRAKFKDFKPALSKRRDTDGIVSLIAGEVRRIQIDNHIVDVSMTPFQRTLSVHFQRTVHIH